MDDLRAFTRRKNGEGCIVIACDDILNHILGLHPRERGAGARFRDDVESIGLQSVQSSARVVDELSDLYSVMIIIGKRSLDERSRQRGITLRASSPVFLTEAVTSNSWTPFTDDGPETANVSSRVAETAEMQKANKAAVQNMTSRLLSRTDGPRGNFLRLLATVLILKPEEPLELHHMASKAVRESSTLSGRVKQRKGSCSSMDFSLNAWPK